MSGGQAGSSIFRRSRCTQTSMTFDIASNGASQTCSAMSPRLTTSLACRIRCSRSAYSRAVSVSGSPRRRARRARVSSSRIPARRIEGVGGEAPANNGAESRQELAEIERLREVVVGAAVQAGDPRLHRVARGQHQYGNRRSFLSNGAAHREPVLQRQHDVEDDGVVFGNRRLVDRTFAVAHDVNGVRLLTKALREHLCRARLVFDQEDTHAR